MVGEEGRNRKMENNKRIRNRNENKKSKRENERYEKHGAKIMRKLKTL